MVTACSLYDKAAVMISDINVYCFSFFIQVEKSKNNVIFLLNSKDMFPV